jgi:hypothetical protein
MPILIRLGPQTKAPASRATNASSQIGQICIPQARTWEKPSADRGDPSVMTRASVIGRDCYCTESMGRVHWNAGRVQVDMRKRGLRVTPREGAALRRFGVLDSDSAIVGGCQYRLISAATIKNTTHKNSNPRIHKLSR